MSQKRTGRIRPHQRDADQSGTILGSDLDLPADLKAKCNETLKLQMGTNCRRDYRHRLKRIINFWKEESPVYYEVGVNPVGSEDLADETKYFFSGTGAALQAYSAVGARCKQYFCLVLDHRPMEFHGPLRICRSVGFP